MALEPGGAPESDFALLERWRQDDRDAGNTVVERYFVQIQRFFGASVKDDARQDLTQETFAKLVKAKDGFQGRGSFRTFLFGIARHVLYDYFRSRQRQFDPITHSVEDVDEPTPSQLVALEQQHVRLLSCMRVLPIDRKIMLEMYYWQGLTADQVGQIYEIPGATVRTRVHTARQRLQRCMAGESAVVVHGGGDEDVADDAAVPREDAIEIELRAIGRLIAYGPTAV